MLFLITGDVMFSEVEKYCLSKQLFALGDNIVIACSGGPDSLLLLEFFLSIKDKWNLKIRAAHFEHGIRGDASKADADFVEKYCLLRDIPFSVDSADVPAYAKENKMSVEAAARKLRYEFLYNISQNMGGALIATAHHADDQAETVLMRILRGTGIAGLQAIKPKNGLLIRPFLTVTKAEILSKCDLLQLSPRHDATNDDTIYLRNRLRLKLLPELAKEYNPGIVKALCNLADIAGTEADFLKNSLRKIEHDVIRIDKDKVVMLRTELQKLHLAQVRELFREAVAHFSLLNISFEQLEMLHELAFYGDSGAKTELSGNLTAEVVYDELWLYQGKCRAVSFQKCELVIPGKTFIPELKITIEAELLKENCKPCGTDWAVFDYDKLIPPFYIRPREKGDYIEIKNGRKKIKELLIDTKISRYDREKLPIFTDSKRILWIADIRRSTFAQPDDNTKRFLRLHILYANKKG